VNPIAARDVVTDRRARMQVRIYRSLSAQDAADAAYWRAIPIATRVSQVWTLSEEQWRLRGENPNEPGLRRSVARLLRP
jgi:hypothetical protein